LLHGFLLTWSECAHGFLASEFKFARIFPFRILALNSM
jgi:hypothetical protein